MNENSQFNGTSHAGSSAALGFVLGALVGAGIAILLAPGTGRETRRRIVDAGEHLGNTARSKFGQARDAVNDFKRDAASALEAGREAFEVGQKSHEPPAAARNDRKA